MTAALLSEAGEGRREPKATAGCEAPPPEEEEEEEPEVGPAASRAEELEGELAALRRELEAQRRRARKAEAAASQEARLREEAEGQVSEHANDLAEQACDQGELEGEVKRIGRQCEQVRGELARSKADLVVMERKLAEAERALADKEQLARRPEMLLAAKERKVQLLQKQIDDHVSTIRVTKDQLAEARAVAQKAMPDVAAEDSHEHLASQLMAARRDRAFTEEKIWRLEEELEERGRLVEEAEKEAQRLAGLLDEEETRRRELGARLDAAEAAGEGAAPPAGKPQGAAPPAEQPAPEPEARAAELERERLRKALEAQATELEGAWRENARLDSKLKVATNVLAELEAMSAQRRAPPAEAEDRKAGDRKRLEAAVKRCHQLEAAGRKLRAELDERDQRLSEQSLEALALRRRVSDLSLSLEGRGGRRGDPVEPAAGPRPRAASRGRRVWTGGSDLGSGSEAASASSSGRFASRGGRMWETRGHDHGGPEPGHEVVGSLWQPGAGGGSVGGGVGGRGRTEVGGAKESWGLGRIEDVEDGAASASSGADRGWGGDADGGWGGDADGGWGTGRLAADRGWGRDSAGRWDDAGAGCGWGWGSDGGWGAGGGWRDADPGAGGRRSSGGYLGRGASDVVEGGWGAHAKSNALRLVPTHAALSTWRTSYDHESIIRFVRRGLDVGWSNVSLEHSLLGLITGESKNTGVEPVDSFAHPHGDPLYWIHPEQLDQADLGVRPKQTSKLILRGEFPPGRGSSRID